MPFDQKVLADKLSKLDVTQAKIETLSSWCQFYRKEARKVVHVWEHELPRAPPHRQLAMAYLANDILQNRYDLPYTVLNCGKQFGSLLQWLPG